MLGGKKMTYNCRKITKRKEITPEDIEFYIECVKAYYNPRDEFETNALKKLSDLK